MYLPFVNGGMCVYREYLLIRTVLKTSPYHQVSLHHGHLEHLEKHSLSKSLTTSFESFQLMSLNTPHFEMLPLTKSKDLTKVPKVRATLRRNGFDLVRDVKYTWRPVWNLALKGAKTADASALLGDLKVLSERDKWDPEKRVIREQGEKDSPVAKLLAMRSAAHQKGSAPATKEEEEERHPHSQPPPSPQPQVQSGKRKRNPTWKAAEAAAASTATASRRKRARKEVQLEPPAPASAPTSAPILVVNYTTYPRLRLKLEALKWQSY
jgi:hypothetical protein